MAHCYYCGSYLGDMRYKKNKENQSIVSMRRRTYHRRSYGFRTKSLYAHMKCKIEAQKKEFYGD